MIKLDCRFLNLSFKRLLNLFATPKIQHTRYVDLKPVPPISISLWRCSLNFYWISKTPASHFEDFWIFHPVPTQLSDLRFTALKLLHIIFQTFPLPHSHFGVARLRVIAFTIYNPAIPLKSVVKNTCTMWRLESI